MFVDNKEKEQTNGRKKIVCIYLWFSDNVWGQFNNGEIPFADCFFQLVITDSYKFIHDECVMVIRVCFFCL